MKKQSTEKKRETINPQNHEKKTRNGTEEKDKMSASWLA
jgi:hypothetical protein